MNRRLRLTTTALLALVASEARTQALPAELIAGVQVTVVVDSAGRARVVERYRVPRDTGALQLQLLERACASVGVVTLSNYVDTRILASTNGGPWTTLRDTTAGRSAYNADSSGFDISYTVSLDSPSADIPLVQLTRPVPRVEERLGSVSLSVATDGEVRFPRLTRAAPGQLWVGRFVAIPSFAHVERPKGTSTSSSSTNCAAVVARPSSDGGLSWRIWTLVVIMVAWVPVYLAWARRAQEGEA